MTRASEDAAQASDVVFAPASCEERARGLLGWVRFRYAGLRIDGVALRRTLDHRLTLAFPRRTDQSGREHDLVHPVDGLARDRIERAVFEALGLVSHCHVGHDGAPGRRVRGGDDNRAHRPPVNPDGRHGRPERA